MSDAAEYWHRQYEALKREHVALIEQTAALRAEVEWFRDVVSEYFGYDAPGGSAINPLPEKLQEWRRETAALRAALTTLAIFYPYGGQQSNTWQCRLCRYVNIHESGCVLAAPEAEP